MDLSAINPVLFVAGFLVAATPLIFAALGELVVEKSGVLNLGVEGMMIIGAICGFATAVETLQHILDPDQDVESCFERALARVADPKALKLFGADMLNEKTNRHTLHCKIR